MLHCSAQPLEFATSLARAVYPLTFLWRGEAVRQAGRLAVGDPGGSGDPFEGIRVFIGDYLAWSVEVIQSVRIIWLRCFRVWKRKSLCEGCHLLVGRRCVMEASRHAVGSLGQPSVRALAVRVVEAEGGRRSALGRTLWRHGPSMPQEVFPQPCAVLERRLGAFL